EPDNRHLIRLAPCSILLLCEEHAVREFVPLSVSIFHDVSLTGLRIDYLHLSKHALRKDVVDLRQIVFVRGAVIEIPIPDIEQQMNGVRSITHAPKSILRQFQTPTFRPNDPEGF